MTQTRRGSATETAVSTSVGFAVSWAATLVVLPAFGFPATHGQAFGITCIYTVLSLVRGYVVRRAFNRLAKPMASQLAGYTDDELLEELVRRRNGLAAAEDEKLPWCHDCAHCLVWDGDGDPPRSWTVCGKGHKPRFQAPRDMGEAVHGDYGFFMRVCRDRLLREGCARCTTRAAPHDPPRQHIREAKKSLDSSNTMK